MSMKYHVNIKYLIIFMFFIRNDAFHSIT
jgi:hypothetical protein